MSRPIHFEIPSDDPKRAMRFFSEVFGWEFSRWDGPFEYWLVTTGPEGAPGINGGLMRRPQEGAGVVNTIGVDDLDAIVTRIEAQGGRVVVPRMAVAGVGWVVYFADPDGHVFGALEADPSAA